MDAKYVGPERRGFQRLKIPLFIFYRSKIDSPFTAYKAIIRNIGGAGLMFETDKSLPVRKILYLEIYQPSVKYKDLIFLVSVQAKVIWVNKKKDASIGMGDNKYQIGVEFVEIEKADKDRIIEYIERIKKLR